MEEPKPDESYSSTSADQQRKQQDHEQRQLYTKSHSNSSNMTNNSPTNKRCIVSDFDNESDRGSVISAAQSSYQKNHKRKKRKKIIYEHSSGNSTSYMKNGKGKKRKCMSELMSGIFIYSMCVFAPVIFGILVKWYENYFVLQFATMGGMGGSVAGGDDDYYDTNEDHDHLQQQLHQQQQQHHHSQQQFQQQNDTVETSFFKSFLALFSLSLSYIMNQLFHTITKIILNLHSYQKSSPTPASLFSSYSKDVQFIIIATVVQSVVRVILVHLLVPRFLVPRRLIAFVRNKSTHLLSASAYEWNNKNKNSNNQAEEEQQQQRQQQPATKKKKFIRFLAYVGRSIRRALGHETPSRKAAAARKMTRKMTTSPMRQLSTSFNPSSLSTPLDYESLDATQALRLFSAPRYATAIFRLVFCTLSCLWALVQFRKASYWPLWVGGSFDGHTKHCWDLSGTIDPSFVLEKQQKEDRFHQYQDQDSYHQHHIYDRSDQNSGSLDFDFDNQNSALRYFFLGQVSYQLQSLCFHFLSMLLLLIYGGGNNDSEEGAVISARTSFKSYIRPVAEHSIYFVLTITTFFFSALRRLGSITIFALEVSSLVLQLLQICINAPESSPLRSPRVIRFVHHYLALPVFVYCRFFIIPFIVQYSAAFESSVWLRQIDHAFLPGCGMVIYLFFNGTLLLALVLNFVYLRRLIFHPYVKRVSMYTTNKN